MNKGIPTLGPRNIKFRSRLEAKYAYLWDHFGWDWDFEPIDLSGYIPDFMLYFDKQKKTVSSIIGSSKVQPIVIDPLDSLSNHGSLKDELEKISKDEIKPYNSRILVEIKGLVLEQFREAAEKMFRSGYEGHCLFLGSRTPAWKDQKLQIEGRYVFSSREESCKKVAWFNSDGNDMFYDRRRKLLWHIFDDLTFRPCCDCETITPFYEQCIVCGSKDSFSFEDNETDTIPEKILSLRNKIVSVPSLWSDLTNKTQWKKIFSDTGENLTIIKIPPKKRKFSTKFDYSERKEKKRIQSKSISKKEKLKPSTQNENTDPSFSFFESIKTVNFDPKNEIPSFIDFREAMKKNKTCHMASLQEMIYKIESQLASKGIAILCEKGFSKDWSWFDAREYLNENGYCYFTAKDSHCCDCNFFCVEGIIN